MHEIEAENEYVLLCEKGVEKEKQKQDSNKKYHEKIGFIKDMFDEIILSATNLDKRCRFK